MSDRVVLVDDDRALLKATSQTLELAGFKVAAFTAAADALAGLDDGFSGVIVTDVRMPGMDGLDFFERIRAIDGEIPVVLVTGHGDIAMAVRAMRDGAYDFLTKPFAADTLVQSVRRAMEKRALVIENRQLRQAARSVEGDLPLIGQSRSIERLRDMLRQIADTNVDVLVRGETGSGKEVVATLLHRWSRRAKGNFVAVNCGALPEQIIESELFGHEPGAFTGAQKKRIGRIEHSSGGTLFLDEIESMPLDAQVRMLRVLEMRQVAPLGTNEIRPVDIRVVAAAKVDLGDPAQRSGFREDLYYRLNVVSLAIPPLRERREDIPLLFSHFADRAARRFDRDVPPLSPAVSRHLREYDFPGNVRELSHFAERFVLGVAEFDTGTESDALGPAMGDPGATLPARMEKYEEAILRETLEAYAGDVQQSIAALGIPRKTFYDKLQRHGIIRADYGGK